MATGWRIRVRRWLRRWVANPIASVVLMGVLVGDAFTLPKWTNGTVVGHAVGFMFTARPTGPHAVDDAFIVQGKAGWRVVDPESVSWDDLATFFYEGADPAISCQFRHEVSRGGFWSHVYEREWTGVRLRPMVGSWSDDELAEARGMLFDQTIPDISGQWWLDAWGNVAAGDIVRTRIVWRGVAHDVFAFLIFAALLYSFTGWPAWFAQRPWSIRSRRLARGLCQFCGYDLWGLDGTVCPECGETSVIPPSKP